MTARRCARVVWFCSATLVGLWPWATVEAQTGTLQQRLAAATTVSCSFTAMATATWEGVVPGTTGGPATLEVSFTNVNADEGSAEAASGLGRSPVVVRASNDYLHLMQLYSAGPLYTTTVLAKESKAGRLMAVHTRHEYTLVSMPGFTSRPEMYVGDCTIGSAGAK